MFAFYLDVALVTSLRDGMNLVSYEFVACQDSKKGVLILSEVSIVTLYIWLAQNLVFICITAPTHCTIVVVDWKTDIKLMTEHIFFHYTKALKLLITDIL